MKTKLFLYLLFSVMCLTSYPQYIWHPPWKTAIVLDTKENASKFIVPYNPYPLAFQVQGSVISNTISPPDFILDAFSMPTFIYAIMKTCLIEYRTTQVRVIAGSCSQSGFRLGSPLFSRFTYLTSISAIKYWIVVIDSARLFNVILINMQRMQVSEIKRQFQNATAVSISDNNVVATLFHHPHNNITLFSLNSTTFVSIDAPTKILDLIQTIFWTKHSEMWLSTTNSVFRIQVSIHLNSFLLTEFQSSYPVSKFVFSQGVGILGIDFSSGFVQQISNEYEQITVSSNDPWCTNKTSSINPCEPGYIQISDFCIPCPPGGYALVSQFYPCPRGTYNPEYGANSILACKPCPSQGFVSHQGSATCTACNTTHSIRSHDDPSQCVLSCPSHQQQIGMACIPCADGSIYSQSIQQCLPCPKGTTSQSGSICVPCDFNYQCPTSCPQHSCSRNGMDACESLELNPFYFSFMKMHK